MKRADWSQPKVLAAITERPYSRVQLQAALHISMSVAKTHLAALHKSREIFIAEWVCDANGRMNTAVYALGNQRDAVRPEPKKWKRKAPKVAPREDLVVLPRVAVDLSGVAFRLVFVGGVSPWAR